MADKRKVQLETGLDASGVRKGAAEVKDVVRDMAAGVQQEAGTAARGVAGIGEAGARAATQLEAAGGGITGSLKRSTKEAVDAGKVTADGLVREGERGRKGLAAAGDGGTEAAKKIDAATRNIANRIQVVLAVAEAGEK